MNDKNGSRYRKNGYSGKGYITKVIAGKPVNIPISQIKIIPPTSGTGAVILKQK